MSAQGRAARACFAVALGCGVVALLPSVVGAQPKASAPGIYEGQASAAGVQYAMDSHPSLFPSVADALDYRTPAAITTMDSGSQATAEATLVYPGAAAELPALLCLAGFPCDQTNQVTSRAGVTWPPDYPLAASAAVPGDGKVHTAQASGREVGGAKQPVDIQTGQASAQAVPTDVRATAVVHSASLAPGLPAPLSNGASQAVTRQYVTRGEFTTEADSSVQDIDIGGIVHIASVHTRAVIANDGHGHLTRAATVQVSGVVALGHGATIDKRGITIAGTGDGGQLTATLNKSLQTALTQHGISMHVVGVDNQPTGSAASSSATGLLVTYQHKVSGVPNVTGNLPCLPSKTNCLVSAPSPNATYYGTALYGNAAVLNFAAPAPTFGGTALTPPGSTAPSAGRTVYVPGRPGTPGTSGSASASSGGAALTGGGSGTGQQPQLAGRTSSVSQELLGGTASRLGWLFGALLAAAVGAVLSRRQYGRGRWPLAAPPGEPR